MKNLGISGIAAVVVSLALLVLVVTQNFHVNRNQQLELLQLAYGQNSAPFQANSLIQVQVPLSQLSETKVGEIVKGQVPAGDNSGRKVAFTGQVTNGYGTSGSLGALTVRVLSDKYVAPGTSVSGRVGNTLYAGTVINSPNTEERLANLEKRLAAVEKPAKDQVRSLQDTVKNMKRRVSAIEGTSTMKDRISQLEKRIFQLQNRPHGLSASLFKDNAEGFHFHGAIGPNTLTPQVDQMERRVRAVERAPDPDRITRPVARRIDALESRLDALTSGEHPRDTAAGLEKRLAKLEKKAAHFAGELAAPEDRRRR